MNGPSTGIVLAAHGERGGNRANARTHQLVEEVRAVVGHEAVVKAGFFKAKPSLEEAIGGTAEEGVDRLIVLPLLMADGYFARKLLPPAVARAAPASQIILVPPIGCEPALQQLALSRAHAIARQRGWTRPSVLVVGHGTRASRASRQTTEDTAALFGAAEDFSSAAFAFLDDEPAAAEALQALAPPTIVVPYLWSAGRHALEDLRGLETADITVDRPLGEDPRVAAIVIESLARTGAIGHAASMGRPRRASAR